MYMMYLCIIVALMRAEIPAQVFPHAGTTVITVLIVNEFTVKLEQMGYVSLLV